MTASLLAVVGELWEEALRCSQSGERAALERAIRCMYAGLEFVLPTAIELQFRLFLITLLQTHTKNVKETLQHLQKCLILVQNVGYRYLAVVKGLLVECRLSSPVEISNGGIMV